MATNVIQNQDPSVLADRLGRLADLAADRGVDATLLTPGADTRYLLGAGGDSFERLTCLVVPSDRSAAPTFVVPKLELPAYEAVPAQEVGLEFLTWVDGQDPYTMVADLLRRGGRTAQVAVADTMPMRHALPLRERHQAPQVLAGTVTRELRMRKDGTEIQALREVGAAIDRVHARVPEFLKAGRTEAEVGADINAAMLEEGHTAAAFIIVGSGPNGASPHHSVSERVIRDGDVVVVDIGGPSALGYNSDCTRTYAVGDPGKDVLDTYARLEAAQAAAVRAVRPGVTAESIDRAARTPLAEAGLGEFFIHRTGHGIGIDVHEEPWIVEGSDSVLEPGMAFSVEPGLYQAGKWGARIEDIVVVTDDGVESLNNQPHSLTVLPA